MYTVQVNMTNLANMLPGASDDEGQQDQNGSDNVKPTSFDDTTDATSRSLKTAFSRLMVDAVRRVTSGEPSTRALGALLESIQDSVSTTVGVEPDSTRLVDYLTRLESRAAKWTADSDVETIASDEMRRALKAFVFGAHEDRAKVVLNA